MMQNNRSLQIEMPKARSVTVVAPSTFGQAVRSDVPEIAKP